MCAREALLRRIERQTVGRVIGCKGIRIGSETEWNRVYYASVPWHKGFFVGKE